MLHGERVQRNLLVYFKEAGVMFAATANCGFKNGR
jgi:hypothetical protein